MTIALSEVHALARLQATRSFLDLGALNARVRLYEGMRPAKPDDTPSSVMLAEIKLTKPCGTITNNQLTLTPESSALITQSGIATWARIVNGDETTAIDLDCSEVGGSGDIHLETTQLYAGGYAYLSAAKLS
jgi:hypothetical protein